MEEWRRSKMCPDYEVNNHGVVRHRETKEKRYPDVSGNHDLQVCLEKDGELKNYKLAEIVADAYCGKGFDHSNLMAVHKNQNRQDNRPENLKYVPKRNVQDKPISYRDDKIRCMETGTVYYNAYACKDDLGIPLYQINRSAMDYNYAPKANNGKQYHFEVVDN